MKKLLLLFLFSAFSLSAASNISQKTTESHPASVEVTDVFNKIEAELTRKGFNIKTRNQNRPWGGFFVIDEAQTQEFATEYFDGMGIEELSISGKLSPKILLVAPQKRLSWQYHHRRAEIWKVLFGYVGVITSDTDSEGELITCLPGDLIRIQQEQRHRLVGLDEWGVVAEIWQHTDIDNPSDENDIVRIQDDFNR